MSETRFRRQARRAAVALVAAAAASTVGAPGAVASPLARSVGVGFSAVASAVNANRVLTITVTTDGIILPWSFSFTLPTGITRNGAPTDNCVNGTIGPPVRSARGAASPDTWYLSGNPMPTEFVCTFTFSVTSATEAIYQSCPGAITGLSGLSGPGSCATIRFEAPHPHRGAVAR
ncbi:hypothetical protein V5P93_005266 [Actinokineospora auranticolor]|uniref:Secreted protein n=1 Tax=Actinokineospora auranticolor TaxID=155976 RepID=A0A2S6GD41_9PSEU|nr:hypothetical protein [Actinokineospora auranticolor]PPK63122.1 hypothetical protein CLV40_13255 [Actinokineospora auranticolor]